MRNKLSGMTMSDPETHPNPITPPAFRRKVALEMGVAAFVSLILIEFSTLLGPLGLILIPISVWFEWFDTFVHEFGHALVVLISTSEILEFNLYWDGGGSVSYMLNSAAFPIGWVGYAMPPLVGAFLYWEANDRGLETQGTLLAVAAVVTLALLLLPKADPATTLSIGAILVLSLLVLALICATVLKRYIPVDWVQRIVAATMITGGLRSLSYLFGFGEYSDAAGLAELTGMPEAFWVASWLTWTALCVGVVYWLEVRDRRKRWLKAR
jgi:hypothetical protein